MFLSPAYRRWPEYRDGVKDQLSVAMGIAAWGMMTGVALVKSGLGVPEALGMTLLVYAGSAQLAALPLLAADAPLWVIGVAACCVNLRFVVFSIHLRPYVMHLSLPRRLLTGYLTGDLSYVFFVRRYHAPGDNAEQLERQQAYLAGTCGVNYVFWIGFSVLGVLLAHAIPTEWGLGFAGILALLGVGCSLASSHLRRLSALVSGVVAILAWSLPLKLNTVLAIVTAVLVCLVLESKGPRWLRGHHP